ncbi:MAG: alpha amylase family protein [Capsulimonadales bacterium]|nr:alpha amylase family protein [Capsulimonadales bacterium]
MAQPASAQEPTSPVPPNTPATTEVRPSTPLPEPIRVPPPLARVPYLPFPNLPFANLDEANNGVGIAQQRTREKGYQARILWIDATANLDKVNSDAKIATLISKIKQAGFNTIVFEVKPIIGLTLYPSKYAPKMTEWVRPWKTQTLPLDFDPLKEMAAQAKAQGISLLVNMNAFSEGHRDFPGKGPGWDNPQWQTVLYEPDLKVRRDILGTPAYPLTDRANIPPRNPEDLAVYTDLSRWKADPNALIALVDRNDTVVAQVAGAAVATLGVAVPEGGAALIATAPASRNFLIFNAVPGYRLTMDTTPAFVPIGQRIDRQVPLMTNPHHPDVRQRLLNMVSEIINGYPVDGIIFDDRLRYASLNADFSESTRREFEAYLDGKGIQWPDDVFRYEVNFPSLSRSVVPGPYFDAWLTFRALNLRNFMAEVVRKVKTDRPNALVATYVGSWYPDYPDVGANWGATDLQAGFRFLNDAYRRTGWAGLVDFVTTGCYYEIASIHEAAANSSDIGETVEAAGQFSNRAVNDETFVYAGLQLDRFKNKPEALKKALQAAVATTQGIMVFDLSHDFDQFAAVFAEAFQKPQTAPHQVAGFLDEVRAEKAQRKSIGTAPPPVILYRGKSGTGF